MWFDCDSDTTANVGACATLTTAFFAPHRCCVAETHRRGNQHLTTAYGRCGCGKTYERKIWWGRRNQTGWEETT